MFASKPLSLESTRTKLRLGLQLGVGSLKVDSS